MNKFPLPDWARRAVLYQIFPDRFARAEDCSPSSHITDPWDDELTHDSYTGGNLDGITQHLDYVEDLGVNVLWLNPIFCAPSSHKYDTADYTRVDMQFGGNRALRRLVRAAHRRGIRILLDAVCGHCSPEFFAFRNLLRRQQKSPFRAWFHIRRLPVVRGTKSGFNQTYACWHGHPALPQFDTENPDVQEYLIGAFERWLTAYDIDGFRLDAVETVPMPFWERFYKRMKKAKSDVLLVGELWSQDYRFIEPLRMDTLTNFQLHWLLVDKLGAGKIKSEAFAIRVDTLRAHLPKTHPDAMFNFLSNHDVMRVASRPGMNRRRLKMLYLFLLTYPGLPGIYYGDEVGMKGGNPPASRGGMVWDESLWDKEMHGYIKDLIHIRRSEDALTVGRFEWVYANNSTQVAIFTRGKGDERIAIVLYFGKRKRSSDIHKPLRQEGWMVREVLFPHHYVQTSPITIPAESGVVLRVTKQGNAN